MIHTYILTHMHMHTYIHTYKHTYVDHLGNEIFSFSTDDLVEPHRCVYRQTHTHTHIHTHIHTYIHTLHTYSSTLILKPSVSIFNQKNTPQPVHKLSRGTSMLWCMCMYVLCMYGCICICMYVYMYVVMDLEIDKWNRSPSGSR